MDNTKVKMPNNLKASIITLGCKVNEYESQSMYTQLKNAGYDVHEGLVQADIYIINTCAVTNTGEKKSRQMFAKIEKLNPSAKIVVCGCAVQNNHERFLKNKNVIAIVGNNGKQDIVSYINNSNKILTPLSNKYDNMAIPTQTMTRQYVKIQDGCNNFCSYCIIPYLRGRSRSRDLDDIISEIRSTKANEIILTGIDISDYRINGELALKSLIREVDKLNIRFRLSSIECRILDDELITVLKNCKNFCPHFHLSLQSACNQTLKRMNRKYSIEEFKSIVKKIRQNFPTCCISTDIIVGFKGETEQEFKNTYKNLKEIKFDFMHIFPYSVRSGTVASKLSGDVQPCIVKEREHILQMLNLEFKQKFLKKNIKQSHSVLVEEFEDGYSVGYTDNYIYVYIPKKLKVGSIVDVTLVEAYKNGMIASVKEK